VKTSPPFARQHRLLECLAVFHSVLLVVLLRLPSRPWWVHHLSVGLATLWLVWPVVLVVHRGRSVLRVTLPLVLAGAILCFYRIPQSYVESAGITFGLPPGVDLTPHAIRSYFAACKAGRTEAEKDLRAGWLRIETYGFPTPPEYSKILQERYGIEVKPIMGDTGITPEVIGHAEGYNEKAEAEVKRRFGNRVLQEAEEEAFKHRKGDARWGGANG
jgi:hypothetical protein